LPGRSIRWIAKPVSCWVGWASGLLLRRRPSPDYLAEKCVTHQCYALENGVLVNLDQNPLLECAILVARFQLCCKLWGIRWDGGWLGLLPPLPTSSSFRNTNHARCVWDRFQSAAACEQKLIRSTGSTIWNTPHQTGSLSARRALFFSCTFSCFTICSTDSEIDSASAR
jgi:hypothetical protein